ncbi:MAG: hypothetical protein XE08_0288 [Parcubacteria bacterium 32_520]|nr:MAG: hypothetical protein XD75_0569 [Parcubacteria bacterium 33_209]KUK99015.1 MAG: hypothetical protein XE08_0288 [Parcubacteria bacterium 32_520]
MKQYTSKDRVEALMLIKIKPEWQEYFDIFLESAENYIDTFTGRNFVADTEFSEKVYDGDGSREIIIDDFVSIEKITINGETVLNPDDILTYPANQTPKMRVVIPDEINSYFPRGNQNIRVSAKWGYSVSVPKEIEFAATVIVAGMINYAYEHNSEVQAESIDDYNVTYNRKEDWVKYERVKEILEKYKKISF